MRHHHGIGVAARADGIFDDNWNSRTGSRVCETGDSHLTKVSQMWACRSVPSRAWVEIHVSDIWNSKTGLRACKGTATEDSHIAKVGQKWACCSAPSRGYGLRYT